MRVFAINLHSADSSELDRIALSTGGSVYSTSDAKTLIAYYGTLGKLLSEQAIHCSVTLAVELTPEPGVGAVSFGPRTSVKVPFEFRGEANGALVLATTEIAFPMSPGLAVGTSQTGVPIFESDIASSQKCVISEPGVVVNHCTKPAYVVICDEKRPQILLARCALPRRSYAWWRRGRQFRRLPL